ncbi:MAG: SGNH/GDSL hydrolase family protein [Vicinamibacteria bacterium]
MSTLSPTSPQVSKHRRLGVVLGLLTIGICLALLEGGVRFADWLASRQPAAPAQELELLQPNPVGTGSYRLRPNLDIETKIGATTVRIKTNSHGMNWRETGFQGDPARPRVAFLGDSFTFGSWAKDSAHTFVGVFESSLPQNPVEALNFGVGGYGLGDEELILQELALKFGPSYVIVVSYMGNDFRDTWLGLNRENLVKGTAVIDDENVKARVPPEQMVYDDTIPRECAPSAWRRFAEHSAFVRRIEPLLNLEDLCVRFRPNRNFRQPGFWQAVPPSEVALRARDSVLESLSRMETLASTHGARLAVVAMPTSAQVYAERPQGRGFDTAYPQIYLAEFCRDRRIPYLDLLPLLQKQAETSNRRIYLKRDIHLNDFGHEKVGQLIASWFEARVRRKTGEDAVPSTR